jgi:hypothetical protein
VDHFEEKNARSAPKKTGRSGLYKTATVLEKLPL